MQWKCLPVPRASDGTAVIHDTTIYKVFARWSDDGSLDQAFIASVRHLAEYHLAGCEFQASQKCLKLIIVYAQFHAVMSLLFELKAQQQPLEFVFPGEGPLHAQR